MAHSFGDVLLVTLTFSDVSNAKRRPVLVVVETDEVDILVAPVTSHKPRRIDDVTLRDWRAAGLRLPSTVRMAKLATVAKTTVIRELGRLSESDGKETRKALNAFFRRVEQAG